MRTSHILITIAVLACGCEPRTEDQDAGIQLPDAGSQEDAGPTCGDPGDGYGTSLGTNFLPFTLDRCDGTPFEFYGEEEGFCDTRFTLVTAAAGWCVPCQMEAALTEELINEAYGPLGVRVVVVYIQDASYATPDGEDCQGWQDTYGLSNPVVYDPAQETNLYFPAGSIPANLIVDSHGVIVHREYGVSPQLETIRAKLDQLLAGE
jgi:thiol-disulfide isomerase/thioredoxin